MVKKGADLPPFGGVKGADLKKKEQICQLLSNTIKVQIWQKKCANLSMGVNFRYGTCALFIIVLELLMVGWGWPIWLKGKNSWQGKM